MLTQALKRLYVPTTPAQRAFSFKFPQHKELFADDYYDPKKEVEESPYDYNHPDGADYENYE
jgi:hypothetical protein